MKMDRPGVKCVRNFCRSIRFVNRITTESLPERVISMDNLEEKIPFGSNDLNQYFINHAHAQLQTDRRMDRQTTYDGNNMR